MISPCINLCNITNKVCTGCGRTAEQIDNWETYTSQERLDIMYRLSSKKSHINDLKRNYERG